jgi:cyclic-di-GMP-binding protein
MPAESTFDIVSEFDRQELVNAVDQTGREARTRYDLKDSKTEIELGDKEITIISDSPMHLDAVRDMLQTKALRRNLSLKIFDYGTVQEIGGARVRQVITLRQGISDELAKKIQKLIKEHNPKVQARIQGDTLRVGSKSRDDLQAVIKLLRERQDEFPVPLQFTNYR